jgi:hypothetical protein
LKTPHAQVADMKTVSRKNPPWFLAASLSAVLTVIFFMLLNALSLPQLLPCTHPISQSAALALAAIAIFQLVIGKRFLPATAKITLGMAVALIFLAVWLGSYPYSPLGFSAGRMPVLRGFMVTTRSKPRFALSPGEFFTLVSGSPAIIEPVLLTGEVKCAWSSANGGSLDSPDTCDIAYNPPQAGYDILKLHLQPACGLPDSGAEIKISILP